ncbi:MAG: cytochrome c [Nitrospinota bacterium]|nr:MAG: cytochrome c [Nitrospinota bacterium]
MSMWPKRLLLLCCGFFLLWGCGEQSEQGARPLLVKPPPSEQVLRGARLYRDYCAYCHGEKGNGKGLNTPYLPKLPRDYTDGAYMREKSDQDLYEAIAQGGRGVSLSPLMPPYDQTLRPWEIWDLVAFLRTLAPQAPRKESESPFSFPQREPSPLPGPYSLSSRGLPR